jgi:hypothetical protein
MASLNLSVATPTFNANCSVERRVLRAELTGTADLVVRDRVEEFLVGLQDEADRHKVQEVVIDLRKLEFMNSSCFKSFVTWINAVQEAPPDRQYRIKLQSSSNMLWQRRSMHALKCFAVDLVDVES